MSDTERITLPPKLQESDDAGEVIVLNAATITAMQVPKPDDFEVMAYVRDGGCPRLAVWHREWGGRAIVLHKPNDRAHVRTATELLIEDVQARVEAIHDPDETVWPLPMEVGM